MWQWRHLFGFVVVSEHNFTISGRDFGFRDLPMHGLNHCHYLCYFKTSCFRLAERELPVLRKNSDGGLQEAGGGSDNDKTEISDEFSDKTNRLLEYIEKTFLADIDTQGQKLMDKMRLAQNPDQVNLAPKI